MSFDWQDRAECRKAPDPDIFFGLTGGVGGASADHREAKSYCDRCPVRSECLEYTLENERSDDRYGVFGGMGPAERDREAARRRQVVLV